MSNIDSNEKQLICQDEKTLNFIRKARLKHGNKYDYSKVRYIKHLEKVIILCDVHGEFLQTPTSHLQGMGCQKCGLKKVARLNSSNKEEFIKKAKVIHGNFYNYTFVEYVNNRIKVRIRCPTHGEFLQVPSSHLSGNGCPKCADEYINHNRSNTEDFIKKAKLIHNDFYSYSKVKYIKAIEKVIIICPIHGEFLQKATYHLGGNGCPKCGLIKNTKNRSMSLKEFIKKAKLIHGDKYNYSKVVYINSSEKVIIGCHEHGFFEQQVNSHLRGSGCPKCSSSKGEIKIRNYLKSKNIEFVEQKTFKGCKYKSLLKFDFYIPNLHLCIEFDGIQHFEPCSFNGESKEIKIKNLENIQRRDIIKNNYCKDTNLNLLRIRYDEDVEEKLKEYITHSEKMCNYMISNNEVNLISL